MSVAAFSAPPIQAFSATPFLYLQACLLHPSVPDSVSRKLRFALMWPALFFAAIAPFWWRITPIEYSLSGNFRTGIFFPYFICKALEWGTVRDRSHYQYIGFDAKGRADQENEQKQNDISPKLVPADVASSPSVHQKANMAHTSTVQHTTSIFQILLFGFSLGASMRGAGWSFGPDAEAFGPARPTNERKFFIVALLHLLRAHIISNVCIIIMVHQHDIPRVLHTAIPLVDYSQFVTFANILAYLSVGFSLYFQMCLGFEGAAILWLLGTNLLRLVLPTHLAPSPFDSRQFPTLFNRPFEMTDVTGFWAIRWHALFRRPFIYLGYEPATRSPILGKRAAKALGAVVVFAISAWMHDYAIMTARMGISPTILRPVSSLSFTERWGAWIFFLSQAIASMAENMFRSITGKKVGGWPGRVWAFSVVFGMGCLAARSWLALGFAHGLPRVEEWGWQRWILPSASLAPPPLYMKH